MAVPLMMSMAAATATPPSGFGCCHDGEAAQAVGSVPARSSGSRQQKPLPEQLVQLPARERAGQTVVHAPQLLREPGSARCGRTVAALLPPASKFSLVKVNPDSERRPPVRKCPVPFFPY